MAEQTQKTVRIPLGRLVLAMVFLWNPFLKMVDVLPDVIGYALLLGGIAKIADLSLSMEEAQKRFRKLFWISLFKPILQLLLIVGFSNQSYTDKGLPVVAILTLSGFELWLWITAFRELFAGLDDLGLRFGGKAADVGKEDLANFTFVSGIARYGLCVLPELGDLFGGDYAGNADADGFDMARYSGILQACNLVFAGLVGIAWLVMAIRYFRGIAADTPWIRNLAEKYRTEVLPNTGLFLRRGVRSACRMLTVGMVFSFDLYLDGVNIVPPFLPGIFFGLGLWMFAKWAPLLFWGAQTPKRGTWVAWSGAGLAVLFGAVQMYLFTEHAYLIGFGSLGFADAAPYYYASAVCSAAQGILLALFLTLALGGWLYINKHHTGNCITTASEYAVRETLLMQEAQRGKFRKTFVWGMAYCISKVVYGIVFASLPLWWMPHLILGCVTLYHVWARQGELCELVDSKYYTL